MFALAPLLPTVVAGMSILLASGALSPAAEIGLPRDLAATEYRVTWQDRTQLHDVAAAWHAPNRAQGFRTYFTPDGIRVIPRNADGAWSWDLSLVAYGRGSISHPLEQARLFPDENRIRLEHGKVEEWFLNEPRGLKHNFVLYAPPENRQGSGDESSEVHLDLTVGGTLTPVLETDGRSARFSGPAGLGVMYYKGLEVRDALGRVLPSRMEIHHTSEVWTLRLLVDDREAVYPVEIDPLATTAAWVEEIDLEDSFFGYDSSAAGDVNGDGYDDVLVGAFRFDNGHVNEGAAWLYNGSASGVATEPSWMIEGDHTASFIGIRLASAGDVNADGYDDVIVSASHFDEAWVFHGSPTGLSPEPDWIGQGDPSGSYAFEVYSAGDVNGDGYDDVIVSDRGYRDASFDVMGAVYVYHGSPSGVSLGASWMVVSDQEDSGFGTSVGTAGDVNADGYDDVIVGAYWYDNGEEDEGRAFVYHGSASGLSTEAAWTFENNEWLQGCLGASVGTAGDVNGDGYDDVIVGAPQRLCHSFNNSPKGLAYVFHGSDTGLPSEPDWTSELVMTGANFGWPVGTAGDVNNDGYDDVIVGATGYENGETDEGAAFVFVGSAEGLYAGYAWMAQGDQDDAEFGKISGAGDVNGDGIDDVIVGARYYDNGQIDEGRAYLYEGGSADIAPAGQVAAATPLLLAKGELDAVELSWGVSCQAGDSDYEIYEGKMGTFSSHVPLYCTTGGQTAMTLVPTIKHAYFLVVPRSMTGEGSYGTTSDGIERPLGPTACLPRVIEGCE